MAEGGANDFRKAFKNRSMNLWFLIFIRFFAQLLHLFVHFLVNVAQRLAEFPYSLAETFGHIGYFLCAKKDENDDEDKEKFRSADILKHTTFPSEYLPYLQNSYFGSYVLNPSGSIFMVIPTIRILGSATVKKNPGETAADETTPG